VESKKQNKRINKKLNRPLNTENKLVVARGDVGVGMGEIAEGALRGTNFQL